MPAFGSTNTTPRTTKFVIDEANPNDIADGLRLLKLGTVFSGSKRTFTGLTAAATFDLTAIDGTGETVGASNPARQPVLVARTLRVTASGTGTSVGAYVLTDVGGTPTSPATSTVAGIATISDDGKSITFPTTVTAFVIWYVPRTVSLANMNADFAPQP